MAVRAEQGHSIEIDPRKCIGCVACTKICPSKAIRVRGDFAVVKGELCIDCGACIRACTYDAARARTSTPSDLKKFAYKVAMPSLTLYGQFGSDVEPAQILDALTRIGFDAYYDISWMCEMVASATDAYLSDCKGPWPRISVTCPAIVRLIQVRYPDLIAHLVPIETARELAAKLLRRRLAAEMGLDPKEIGIFFITPCSAIMRSIMSPLGLEQSYLDGAFSIAELYGPIRQAIKSAERVELDVPVSPAGLRWAMAGGEIAGMRNANSMTVRGGRDVRHVFDRIESGTFQTVDFIEAYICPDGCVSGQLVIEGRYTAQRSIQTIVKRLGDRGGVKEEKVRSLLREHFFDFEEEIGARPVQPLARDLREAVALTMEKLAILEQLPKKDCAACGSPDCETLAEEIVGRLKKLEDCPFVKIARLEREAGGRKEGVR